MLIAHRIELRPSAEQEAYFRRACGTARFVWNWALAEWNRQYEAGLRPNAPALKKQFNALKYTEHPWLKDMHRDSHSQPFANLRKAWGKFFDDLKKGEIAHCPVFKRKGKTRDSFYVANDKLTVGEKQVRLPVLGVVKMKESPRFAGKIMGATVSRDGTRWYLSLQQEIEICWLESVDRRSVTGVDLNVKEIVCSDGKRYATPRALKKAQKRLKKLQRSVSRKMEAQKQRMGLAKPDRIPKGVRLVASRNREKTSRKLAELHRKIRCIRQDFTHKMTTSLARENQTLVIEDLSVRGMTASARGTVDKPGRKVRQKAGLNRAILDVAFGEIRRQLEYKCAWYGTTLVVAERFFPSSKRCSSAGCGKVNHALTLKDRAWACPACGTHHDRDFNASVNLEQFAALPGATGKVTPVRYELGQSGGSGQEPNAQICARFG
ncbi:RNA-guided endonuclease InsQ/TnpB family protein [Paraburkholderia phenoliruptrix]|uniref:RNA-guided endonuclease InsQ/TnpB family protein n=1 Tax=Paraburkholderia phenoliruptrix TaxID=252970 RepID=UPI002869C935|nr:RNA-guided endonuclease TnpB family protein [Paraburkholderia phenoliruptrix]WMY10968.1 RNA-guided endonuclease TnpB family protein [Paraburkholderia phenoliruptrix]